MATEIANLSLNPAMDTVIRMDELIFLILDAIKEPEAMYSLLAQCKQDGFYRDCMLVNRQWRRWAERFLWGHLTRPHDAFNAVLRQFDIPVTGSYAVTERDLALRRPREAYASTVSVHRSGGVHRQLPSRSGEGRGAFSTTRAVGSPKEYISPSKKGYLAPRRYRVLVPLRVSEQFGKGPIYRSTDSSERFH